MGGDSAGVRSESRDYAAGPPWLFRGSALYQLHLVKAEIARSFIPSELRLVEAFGYTLGGFFLACYEDSPAGPFDELVVIPGIVWNPPTSCAWAARVLVNSDEACQHGRKEVGLPSQVAIFTTRANKNLERPDSKRRGFLGWDSIGSYFNNPRESSELEVSEIHGSSIASLCTMSLPFSCETTLQKWAGPMVKLSLPSFSGKTKFNPSLLKYSCQIECRIQTALPAKISSTTTNNKESDETDDLFAGKDSWNRCISVLLSKPVMAMRFNCLRMLVHAPTAVLPPSSIKIGESS